TGKTIIGKATVERFINTGLEAQGGHRKSWQLLAISTIGQTIKQSWMENATAPTGMPGGDPKPGYGIMITGRLPNAVAEGFDVRTTPGASIKAYNSSTGTYDEPNSTHLPIYDPRGYMVMVRGDRSVFTHNGDAKPTTLRTKGNFIIGDHSVDVPANSFASIGNPYASAIEINKIVKTGGVTEVIAFWDPLLSGGYGLGGFVYLAKTGDHYIATPLTGSYSGPVKHIQSGQAFFVQTNAAGKVSFAENAKVSGSELVMRQENRDSRTVLFKTNLYGINPDGTAFIADGTLMQLGDEFSNEIDRYDAIKMSNTSENLSIRSGGKNIAVERRQHVNDFDTIFYNLTGVRAQKYRLSFIAQDMQRQGLDAFLEDIYLGTKTPINLNGSTDYDFTIENIPGSYASDRFRIVFHAAFGPLSVTFISVNATESEGDIQVKWKVENENGIQAYKVEKSSDGLSFYEVAHINAGNLNEYNWTDKNAYTGNNYYRINSIGLNGKDEISRTVKVLIQADPSKISIYPNPITNGVVNVHLSNQPSGKYSIRLLNPAGQIIVHKVVTHIQGNSSHAIKWDYKMARGMYQIEVTKPDGLVHMIKVVY
ncbi:MAG: T9SS type A sorting domain-containing protein, partial [Ginsengibacter sp.]